MPIKVAIVEDDVRVLKILVQLIGSTEGFCCVGQHSTAENALEEISVELPDVVLMEIGLPGMNGVECVRRLKEKFPEMLIVMLTAEENAGAIFNALSAGACGYLLKRSSAGQIMAAIQEVYDGGSPMTSSIARRVVRFFQEASIVEPGHAKLSPREQQVIDYLSQGYTYKKIAGELKVSYATVHTHIRHIYKKLRVNSRTSAAALHIYQTVDWRVQSKEWQYKIGGVLNQAGILRNSAVRAS